ncbi:winged helix-turn-helix transcriptional regulator [Nocardioides sp.]|uniref:winged helix-turn-helix transcriptional regulator n=1 Tax=Nocardioides sp. TaxID=35761 RepID=UPI0039E2E7ED
MAEKNGDPESHRSALGQALALLGDMWTLRIVMWVFIGKRRFQDVRKTLSISDPVLSRRLNALVDAEILQTHRYQTNPPRYDYLLTDRGLELWQVLVAMWAWDRRWAGRHHRDARTQLRHLPCDNVVRPVFGCGCCGAIGVTARDVRGKVDDQLLADFSYRRGRRSPSLTADIDATGVLGDRWSTFLLSDAFTGTHRFNDFQANLGISPVTLAQRLNLFVEAGLMTRDEPASARRPEYRLTPKALDFFDVTTTINGWAQRWLSEDGHSGLSLTHVPCGQELVPQHTCNACNQPLRRTEIRFEGKIGSL